MSGLGILRTVRLLLVLGAIAVFGMTIYVLKETGNPFAGSAWPLWLTFALTILSTALFIFVLKGRGLTSGAALRSVLLIIIAAAWLVSPCYHFSLLVKFAAGQQDFFTTWYCRTSLCNREFGLDICGFLMAFFTLVETFLSRLYEHTVKPSVGDTIIIQPPYCNQPASDQVPAY